MVRAGWKWQRGENENQFNSVNNKSKVKKHKPITSLSYPFPVVRTTIHIHSIKNSHNTPVGYIVFSRIT